MIAGKVKTNVAGFGALVVAIKQRDTTLKGAKAAAQVVSRSAKPRAPKVSGALQSAIGWKARKGKDGATDSFAVVGARKRVVKMVTRPGRRKPQKAVPALYLHLIEKGVKPHHVGKGSSAKKGKQSGGMHPGFAAKPFLRPAYLAAKTEAGKAALKAMGDDVQKQIARAAAKVTASLK